MFMPKDIFDEITKTGLVNVRNNKMDIIDFMEQKVYDEVDSNFPNYQLTERTKDYLRKLIDRKGLSQG